MLRPVLCKHNTEFFWATEGTAANGCEILSYVKQTPRCFSYERILISDGQEIKFRWHAIGRQTLWQTEYPFVTYLLPTIGGRALLTYLQTLRWLSEGPGKKFFSGFWSLSK